jgi:hypothetical protein
MGDDPTPDGYDQPTSYVPCPCSTLRIVSNEFGEWLVCSECRGKIQIEERGVTLEIDDDVEKM